MTPIVPAGKLGIAEIRHVVVSSKDAATSLIRSMVTGNSMEALSEGAICQLYVGGTLMMSDTPMERKTNRDVVLKARGEVLISGLGLGMILIPILKKPEVTRVTVLEQSQDVIDLVGPHFRNPRLTLVCADVFTYRPPHGKRYNTIYHDIWSMQSTDTLKEMSRLHRKYGHYLAVGGWQESWRRAWLRLHKTREAKEARRFNWGGIARI